AHAARPGVSEQAVGKQPEVIWLVWSRRDADALAAEPPLVERDLVFARRQVEMHRPAGPRAGLERVTGRVGELQQHIGEADISFVADVGYQHGNPFVSKDLRC